MGVSAKWNDPTDDLTAYLVAATYYVHDQWRFPLFTIPHMGYPEGGSVIYNDAVPLPALLAKLVSRTTGLAVNYLGPWMLVCYVLQAVTSARLAFALGNRSVLATAAFAAFTTGSAIFLLRTKHIALCSTFLLFWAFLAYLRTRAPDVRLARTILPPVMVSFLINPYLFAMVTPIVGAGVLSAWRHPQLRRQLASTLAIGAAVGLILVVICGFGSTGVGVRGLADSGFGYFSWNPATLVIPVPHGFWQAITSDIVRDATGGQYEGESYLGLVPVVLLAAWLLLHPRDVLERLARHKILLLVLASFCLHALSNRAYVRSMPLWDISLPDRVMIALSVFRTSGRFIWPVAYLLMVLPGVALLGRSRRRPFWIALLVLGGIVQVMETMPDRASVKRWSREPSPDLVDVALMRGLIGQHGRIWQFPSYFCGGLGQYTLVGDLYREPQVQVLAAKAGVPNNSVYMGRALKDCDRERREAAALQVEPDVLYILSKDAVLELPNLSRLSTGAACRELDWAFICSSRLAAAQTQPPSQP